MLTRELESGSRISSDVERGQAAVSPADDGLPGRLGTSGGPPPKFLTGRVLEILEEEGESPPGAASPSSATGKIHAGVPASTVREG